MRGIWYLTGDRGLCDDDEYFWFIGRAEDVIISGSQRIGPFEVLSLLDEHPAVMEAAAVAFHDEDLSHVIRAFIVLWPGFQGDEKRIEGLRGHFTEYTEP